MDAQPPPGEPDAVAAWRHRDARDGFEVAFTTARADGRHVAGDTTAVEDGVPWAVRYAIDLSPRWVTRGTLVTSLSATGERRLSLEGDGRGGWLVDGAPRAALGGCLDVDLESSVVTNAFPVHRLGLAVGESAQAPAAYVRAATLRVERLEQRYVRLDDDAAGRRRFHYSAPAFAFACELVYADDGLLLDYPGIATRVRG